MTTTNDKVRSKASAKEEGRRAPARDDERLLRSLGAELESRGASIMAVPPEVAPLPLDAALDRWSMSRTFSGTRMAHRALGPGGGLEPAKPRAPLPASVRGRDGVIGQRQAQGGSTRCDSMRDEGALLHRRASGVRGRAVRRGRTLGKLLEETDGLEHEDGEIVAALTQGMGDALGATRRRVRRVARIRATRARRIDASCRRRLGSISATSPRTSWRRSPSRLQDECNAPETVLMSSCIVRQDTNTLTTTATVTTLAPETTLDELAKLIDPLRWPKSSSVIKTTKYVARPLGPRTAKVRRQRAGHSTATAPAVRGRPRELGVGRSSEGRFQERPGHRSFPRSPEGGVSLPFKLCRSIDSRIMWDSPARRHAHRRRIPRRPGRCALSETATRNPIRATGGSPRARCCSSATEPRTRTRRAGCDFGQMLNYLAPAAVTWWLETDFYSSRPWASSRRLRQETTAGERGA